MTQADQPTTAALPGICQCPNPANCPRCATDELTAHLVAGHGLPLDHVEAWGPIGRAYNHQLEHDVLKQEHAHA